MTYRRRPYEPFILPKRHDTTIRQLWQWGWDTARITEHINHNRFMADEPIQEQDVYNVLDRALGRLDSGIVKVS